jgi:hypothetical protein
MRLVVLLAALALGAAAGVAAERWRTGRQVGALLAASYRHLRDQQVQLRDADHAVEEAARIGFEAGQAAGCTNPDHGHVVLFSTNN